jgi:hypothetical protein
MDPTTTRGNWTIDNRTGVIGHAKRDYGIDLAWCATPAHVVARLGQAALKSWITDADLRDLIGLMAEALGVEPGRCDGAQTSRLAATRLVGSRLARRSPLGPPVGFVPVERYLTLD